MVPRIEIARDGPVFSRLVQGYWRLGQWELTPSQMQAFIEAHLELGITTVDHASVYGPPSCERQFGEAIKQRPSLRHRLEIVSKCGVVPPEAGKVGHYDSSRQSIIESVERSLQNLCTDFLDVLLIHRPDFLMQASEVAEAFAQLKSEGKVQYFGVSNFSRGQFELLQSTVAEPLVTNQIEINPFELSGLENGDLDVLQQHHISPMAWSCLGGGRISNPKSETEYRMCEALEDMKEELGAESVEQVVYAWVMKFPTRPVPILGSSKVERIREFVGSFNISMDREQWYRLLKLFRGYDVP